MTVSVPRGELLDRPPAMRSNAPCLATIVMAGGRESRRRPVAGAREATPKGREEEAHVRVHAMPAACRSEIDIYTRFMTFVVICLVAFLASLLTFFSGFGLGTLLLPAFALFYPVEQAIVFTAIVHFLNGIFKLGLIGGHADRQILRAFGIPAVAASLAGAWVLLQLAEIGPVATYSLSGREIAVTPVKLIVGVLLLLFALVELLPWFRKITFPTNHFPVGGLLSGFFGGLSGMQGALRSAFLARANISKEAFVATGVVIAFLIDIPRLAIYSRVLLEGSVQVAYDVVIAALVAALGGAYLGNRYLEKVTMGTVQKIVAAMLLAVALGLVFGVL